MSESKDQLAGPAAKGRQVERGFERALWGSRFIVLLPILCSLLGAIVMFVIGSVDVVRVVIESIAYATGAGEGGDLHTRVIIEIIGAVDIYLIAIVLLIFSFGLYTLFISRIDEAEDSETSGILEIHSLDSLKDKLSQVVIMALVIKFFQMIFSMTQSFTSPLDMVYLALSILGLALALFFLYRTKGHPKESPKNS